MNLAFILVFKPHSFNLLAQIEQVQDINHYSDYKRRLTIMLLELKLWRFRLKYSKKIVFNVDRFRGYVEIQCFYWYCRLFSRLYNHPVTLKTLDVVDHWKVTTIILKPLDVQTFSKSVYDIIKTPRCSYSLESCLSTVSMQTLNCYYLYCRLVSRLYGHSVFALIP
jgi:hypothetical protein